MPNNLILGFVTARLADAYKIDIGSTQAATLPFSGFEGTTKKNRPILNIGDLVFARVSVATKDLEPEIVCYGVDADSPDAASGFGEIKADWGASMIYHCSCSYARRLQSTNCLVLEVLGRFYAFEIVVGANGRFVIHTANHFRDTFRIAHVIMNFADQPDPSEESIVSFIKSTKSTFAVHR